MPHIAAMTTNISGGTIARLFNFVADDRVFAFSDAVLDEVLQNVQSVFSLQTVQLILVALLRRVNVLRVHENLSDASISQGLITCSEVPREHFV